jgi:hypothetical protein
MKAIAFCICLLTVLTGTASTVDFTSHTESHDQTFLARPQPATFRPNITKTPGHYSKDDWERAIDSVWGPGLPTQEKLDFLDAWWNMVSDSFACFNNLPLTYDSLDALVARYRAEVEDTVSRGRFAGIMCKLGMLLMEAHTWAEDNDVCNNTALLPGVPLQVFGGWRWDRHFGAGLTALEDSTLVVYSVEDNPPHPLGLQPGDIILGYDGRPWPELCQELREAELPVHRNHLWGSKQETFTYTMLISAGLNWHLFDTIDIQRYPTNQVDHLPTSLLLGYEPHLTCSEQLDISGVPKPNLDSFKSVSYGVMEYDDSAVGYIYSWTWTFTSFAEFQEACSVLVSIDTLKGIIIDYRYNEGGYFTYCDGGYYWLFRDTTDILDGCRRTSPDDPYAMTVVGRRTVPGNGDGYAKPVAVLTGPGCYSAGDYAAYAATLLDACPVRTFGRPTNSAHIGGFRNPSIHGDFDTQCAVRDMRKCDDTTCYMTHRGFEPDTFVWHTREAIAAGGDAAVTAAAHWVVYHTAISEPNVGTPVARLPLPTLVRRVLPLPGRIPAMMFDISGRLVMDLEPGQNDIRHVAPGVYFVRQEETDRTTKVVVQK